MRARPIRPTAAAVLRSIQKDEQYVETFKSQVSNLFRLACGPRVWIKWRSELDALATFTYYAATTLSGLQTLGEEYVRIVQIERDKLKVPSLLVSCSVELSFR